MTVKDIKNTDYSGLTNKKTASAERILGLAVIIQSLTCYADFSLRLKM